VRLINVDAVPLRLAAGGAVCALVALLVVACSRTTAGPDRVCASAPLAVEGLADAPEQPQLVRDETLGIDRTPSPIQLFGDVRDGVLTVQPGAIASGPGINASEIGGGGEDLLVNGYLIRDGQTVILCDRLPGEDEPS
jgi:hypothetical protein